MCCLIYSNSSIHAEGAAGCCDKCIDEGREPRDACWVSQRRKLLWLTDGGAARSAEFSCCSRCRLLLYVAIEGDEFGINADAIDKARTGSGSNRLLKLSVEGPARDRSAVSAIQQSLGWGQDFATATPARPTIAVEPRTQTRVWRSAAFRQGYRALPATGRTAGRWRRRRSRRWRATRRAVERVVAWGTADGAGGAGADAACPGTQLHEQRGGSISR